MKNNKSIEDYLEAVYMLETSNEKVKSIRIAEHLKVSRPAVNQMMKELINQGYIEKPNYGRISLTEKGRSIAIETYNKHRLLRDFFVSLGVSDVIAENDCCLVEHILSQETVTAIEKYLENIQKTEQK